MPPLLTADAPGVGFGAGPGQWGIFVQSGQPLLAVDSVDSIEYARDYHVSDYPQEQGAFQSYNKVQTPFQAKVGFLIAAARTDFLNAIEAACASLQLVAVVTPEISYPSANLTHYGYRRDGQSGKTMIRVDVWCEEIRITAGAAFGNSQSNNAAPPSQSGNVQTTPMIQNPPVATDTSVGGSYSPAFGQVAGSTSASGLGLQGSGPGGFMTLPTLPAGVPNSTGGGESALSTPVSDYTDPFAAGGF